MAMVNDRHLAIDFLLPMSKITMAIMIKHINENSAHSSWNVFTAPFSNEVWITFIISIIFLCLLHFFLNTTNYQSEFLEFVKLVALSFWSTLSVTFGRRILTTDAKDTNAFRILCFSIAMSGTCVFIAYRAALTTELSTVKVKMPFHDLHSLARTDYKLLVHKTAVPLVQIFTHAPKGSIYEKIRINNMDTHDYWDAEYPEILKLLQSESRLLIPS